MGPTHRIIRTRDREDADELRAQRALFLGASGMDLFGFFRLFSAAVCWRPFGLPAEGGLRLSVFRDLRVS